MNKWIECSDRLPEIKRFESYLPGDHLDPEAEYYVSDWVLIATPLAKYGVCIARAWHETKADEYGWEDFIYWIRENKNNIGNLNDFEYDEQIGFSAGDILRRRRR